MEKHFHRVHLASEIQTNSKVGLAHLAVPKRASRPPFHFANPHRNRPADSPEEPKIEWELKTSLAVVPQAESSAVGCHSVQYSAGEAASHRLTLGHQRSAKHPAPANQPTCSVGL